MSIEGSHTVYDLVVIACVKIEQIKPTNARENPSLSLLNQSNSEQKEGLV